MTTDKHIGCKPGQGITEYLLIAALVLVVSIGALALLGNKVSGIFGGMLASRPPVAPSNPSTGSNTAAVTLSSATSQAYAQQAASTTMVTLSSGAQVSLDALPTDLKASITTLGANGTTTVLASSLQSLATQLADKGEITQPAFRPGQPGTPDRNHREIGGRHCRSQ